MATKECTSFGCLNPTVKVTEFSLSFASPANHFDFHLVCHSLCKWCNNNNNNKSTNSFFDLIFNFYALFAFVCCVIIVCNPLSGQFTTSRSLSLFLLATLEKHTKLAINFSKNLYKCARFLHEQFCRLCSRGKDFSTSSILFFPKRRGTGTCKRSTSFSLIVWAKI